MAFGTFIIGEIVKRFAEQGHFSDSYLAVDLNLNKTVVVKDIRPDRVNQNAFDSFVSELRNLTAVEHTRICPVIYAGRDVQNDNVYRIVTQYFEKGSLQQLLDEATNNGKTLSISYIVETLLYVCSALDNLHAEGVVHNDLKPSNILLDRSGLPVITDFGQSAIINDPFVDAPLTYWKNQSPEYLVVDKIGRCTDIYQFGLLAYRLLNPKGFDDQHLSLVALDPDNLTALRQAVVDGAFPDRTNLHPFVPKRLEDIIQKCLRVNPLERYQSIYDIQQDLAQVDAYDVSFDFNGNMLTGTLNGYPCEIHIDLNGTRYDIKGRKNGRWQKDLKKGNATIGQARSHLSKKLEELSRE